MRVDMLKLMGKLRARACPADQTTQNYIEINVLIKRHLRRSSPDILVCGYYAELPCPEDL